MSTPREELWKAEYYKCLNATKAARLAGFRWPNKVGPRLKEKFADEINQHLSEIQMSADEVLSRLTTMGRADIADFADVIRATDLKDEKYKGKSQLIKKFKRKITRDALNREHEDIELEFYDAQSALLNIGKQHGLFTDRHIVDVRLEKEVEQILNVLEETLSPDDYQRVLTRLGSGSAGSAETTEPDTGELAQ